MEAKKNLYFDPFAEQGEGLFDPINSFNEIEAAYLSGEIRHDYTADEFVKDTEALMLDATFVERFDAVREIANRMHMLCGEDHGLVEAIGSSRFFGLTDRHSENDGHDHSSSESYKEDEDSEIDPKTGKKRKKKRLSRA